MKKGLRRPAGNILINPSSFKTRPDEEGIKTQASGIPSASVSAFKTRPDEEGIKTCPDPALLAIRFPSKLALMKKGLRRTYCQL